MRIIDADAFLEEARNKKDMQYIHSPIHMIALIIDEMPTVDAEPVVRCKDCKHYTLHCSWNGEKRYWCELDILHDGENGFCSWGAKMDIGEEE